jgi:carbonic anhydrase
MTRAQLLAFCMPAATNEEPHCRGCKSHVVEDFRRIREHPLVSKRIPIYGCTYNVRTGRLEEVEEPVPSVRGQPDWTGQKAKRVLGAQIEFV